MRIKDKSVDLNLNPEVLLILGLVDQWWRNNFGYQLVITAGHDGKHALDSDHNGRNAFDARTWKTERSGKQVTGAARRKLFKDLQEFLGEHFYVHYHSSHFHISYRPKRVMAWNDYPFGIQT